jgi:hypothetical protein
MATRHEESHAERSAWPVSADAADLAARAQDAPNAATLRPDQLHARTGGAFSVRLGGPGWAGIETK